MTHAVAIHLATNPMDCRVLLDGRDISDACRGVDVHAEVGDGRTRVTLHLIANVAIIGEAGQLELHKPAAAAPRPAEDAG